MKKFRSISIAIAAPLFLAACAQAVTPTTAPTDAPPDVATEVPVDEQVEVEDQSNFEEITFLPGLVVGGIRRVEASSVSDDARWILPGPRPLDPAIFGTPDQPLGFEPGTGLPLEMRLVSEDGTAYTTTAGPTPFSDNFAPVQGSFNLSVEDVTLVDGPDSQDKVDFSATFTGPDGKEYGITLLKVIPKGPDHPFFGGAATNIIQHGASGIGTNLMPGAYTPVAFWGVAELTIDGEVVASNRVVHGMITGNPRDEEYRLGFDEDVDNSKVVLHLILPNTEVTPDGPQESPVPTGFILPNGVEQPFFHIMFDGFEVQPAKVVSQ